MKISWIIGLVGLVVAGSAGAATVTSYQTSFGAMHVHNLGSANFSANYATQNGRLFGQFSGHRFVGQWVQNRSEQKCKKEIKGSHFWGRAIFVFSEDFRNFSGQWSYCGMEPSETWNGKYAGGPLPGAMMQPAPQTPMDKCARFPLGCGPGYTDLRLRGIDCQGRTQVGCLCWKGLASKAVCKAYRDQKRR